MTSLDRPLGEEDDAAFGDLLPSDGAELRRTRCTSRCAREALHSALHELPERERKVVELRYGIAGSEPTPLREIGRQLGITPGARAPDRVARARHARPGRRLGVPRGLRALGLPKSAIEEAASLTAPAVPEDNPVPVGGGALARLVRAAWSGEDL